MTSREPEKPIGDILLVDDTPDNLRLLSELLTQQGHKVREVTDEMWALQAAILSEVPVAVEERARERV